MTRPFLKAIILAFAALMLPVSSVFAQSLGELRRDLGIRADKAAVSISGLSSGGWLAVHYHIAYSNEIMGVGVIAAGPYRCASTKSGFFVSDPCFSLTRKGHDFCQALTVCTRTAAALHVGPYLGPPDFQASLALTLSDAEAGRAAPLSGLAGDRVWIFGGKQDQLEPPGVVTALRDYYEALFALPQVSTPPANIALVDDMAAAHAMPVDDETVPYPCTHMGVPFINNCHFSAAAALLAFIYPRLQAHPANAPEPAVLAFDQSAFFSAADPSISMSQKAHLYVPRACRGAVCPLHVALHGCNQNEDLLRTLAAQPAFFFEKAGYNAWAEAHGVIILYPQAAPWGLLADENPQGCWDWLGFSGPRYANRGGTQIEAIRSMVRCLTGEAACP